VCSKPSQRFIYSTEYGCWRQVPAVESDAQAVAGTLVDGAEKDHQSSPDNPGCEHPKNTDEKDSMKNCQPQRIFFVPRH